MNHDDATLLKALSSGNSVLPPRTLLPDEVVITEDGLFVRGPRFLPIGIDHSGIVALPATYYVKSYGRVNKGSLSIKHNSSEEYKLDDPYLSYKEPLAILGVRSFIAGKSYYTFVPYMQYIWGSFISRFVLQLKFIEMQLREKNLNVKLAAETKSDNAYTRIVLTFLGVNLNLRLGLIMLSLYPVVDDSDLGLPELESSEDLEKSLFILTASQHGIIMNKLMKLAIELIADYCDQALKYGLWCYNKLELHCTTTSKQQLTQAKSHHINGFATRFLCASYTSRDYTKRNPLLNISFTYTDDEPLDFLSSVYQDVIRDCLLLLCYITQSEALTVHFMPFLKEYALFPAAPEKTILIERIKFLDSEEKAKIMEGIPKNTDLDSAILNHIDNTLGKKDTTAYMPFYLSGGKDKPPSSELTRLSSSILFFVDYPYYRNKLYLLYLDIYMYDTLTNDKFVSLPHLRLINLLDVSRLSSNKYCEETEELIYSLTTKKPSLIFLHPAVLDKYTNGFISAALSNIACSYVRPLSWIHGDGCYADLLKEVPFAQRKGLVFTLASNYVVAFIVSLKRTTLYGWVSEDDILSPHLDDKLTLIHPEVELIRLQFEEAEFTQQSVADMFYALTQYANNLMLDLPKIVYDTLTVDYLFGHYKK